MGKLLEPPGPGPPLFLSQHQSPNFLHLSNPPPAKPFSSLSSPPPPPIPVLPPLPFSEKGFQEPLLGTSGARKGVCGERWGVVTSHPELEACYRPKKEGARPVQKWAHPPVLQPGYRRTFPGDLWGLREGGRDQPEQAALATLGRGNRGSDREGSRNPGWPQADSPAVRLRASLLASQ